MVAQPAVVQPGTQQPEHPLLELLGAFREDDHSFSDEIDWEAPPRVQADASDSEGSDWGSFSDDLEPRPLTTHHGDADARDRIHEEVHPRAQQSLREVLPDTVAADPLAASLAETLERLRVLDAPASRVEQVMRNAAAFFVDQVRAAVERFQRDVGLLAQTLGGGQEPVLVGIEPTGSDPHARGGQVLVLHLQCGDERKRAIYKPASMAIDYALVGDTQAVGPQTAGVDVDGSFAEMLGSGMIPTHTILPRSDERGPYGYSEHLSHGTEADGQLAEGESPALFHRQMGSILAMAETLSITDLHMENLLVHAREPHLIDLETSFARPMEGLEDTTMRGALLNHRPGYDRAPNRLHEADGARSSILDHQDDAREGYVLARAAMRDNAPEVEAFVRRLGSLQARVLPFATPLLTERRADYVGAADEVEGQGVLQGLAERLTRGRFRPADEDVERFTSSLSGDFDGWDVPAYYQQLDRSAVTDASGNSVLQTPRSPLENVSANLEALKAIPDDELGRAFDAFMTSLREG